MTRERFAMIRNNTLWALLLLVGYASTVHAAIDPAATKEIDAVFVDLDKPGSPGCALGVIDDGQLSYARGYGMASVEHSVPNTPTIVFDIGSTSKQFTATAVLLLAQEGKLTLDDDVRRFVPELPQYQRPITIRHLLNHTSGLRDYLGLFSLAGISFESTTTEKHALDFIVRQKALNFAPGDEFLYSNSGYLLLSVIVQRISGKSFPDFVKERIFDPLGMTHSLVLDDHDKIVPHRAMGYSRRPGGGFMIDMSNFEQTGDGAVLSTVEDLARWDRNFYDPKVGGQVWLAAMHTTGRLSNGKDLIYAAGLEVDSYKGLRRVAHGGAWAGYRAELVRFPDLRRSIVCICNAGTASDPGALTARVAAVLFKKEFAAFDAKRAPNRALAAATRNVDETQAKSAVGLYRNGKTGDLRRISFADGKLRLDSLPSQNRELAPLGANLFAIVGQEEPTVELVNVDGTSSLHFVRTDGTRNVFDTIQGFEPTPDALAEFQGRYFSDELNVVCDMSIEAGRLVVANPNGVKRPMFPTYRDAFFVSSGTQFEFQRDGNGHVNGFNVSAGRIRNVRFVRRDS